MNEYTMNWGLAIPIFFSDKSCGSSTLSLTCHGKLTVKITNSKLTWNKDLEEQIFNDVQLMAGEYIQSVITRTKDFSTLNKDLNYKEFKEQYKTRFEQKGYDITSITFNPQLSEKSKKFIEEKCSNNLETNSNMNTSNLKSEVQDKNSNDIETSNSNNFNGLLLIGIVIIVLLLLTLLIRKKKNS